MPNDRDSAGNSRRDRLRTRLRGAVPAIGEAMGGAVLWALAMSASAYLGLSLDAWETPQKIRFVTALFAVGGALAFPLGLFLARFFANGRRPETRFAAATLFLAVSTVVMTAALYALQYRAYYAEWHAAAFTVTWLFQLVFTALAALYQFAVLGVRLYFPLGFAALFAAALWFARR